MSDAKWFVIHTYSGYENKVKANIEKMVENRDMQDQILEVQVPIMTVEDEQGKEVEEKIYPSYVFVKATVTYDEDSKESSMSDDAWFVIRNTRGVTGFVGPESKATPLPDEEAIKFGVGVKNFELNYKVGDKVKITDEYLEGFVGTVTKINLEDKKVFVTISEFFGRETEVELNLDKVELEEEN